MARTESQWNKKGTYLSPVEDIPVVLLNDYLNFGGSIPGETGYGFRDNAGNMEFKDEGGSWTDFGGGGGGSGNVVGPASAVDDNLASYDTTTGKLIQDSGIATTDVTDVISGLAAHLADPTDAHDASAISAVDTSFDVLEGTEVQAVMDDVDDKLLNTLDTGILFGGRGSVNGGIGASDDMDITAGAGQVLDNTDAENPVYVMCTWTAKTAEPLANIGVQETWWYVDDNTDTIKQQVIEPTQTERRTKCFLFRTALAGGVITASAPEVTLIQQEGASIKHFTDLFGVLRTQGVEVVPSSGTLDLKVTSGAMYRYGSNYDNSYTDTDDTLVDAFDTGVTGSFRYIIPSGVLGTDETEYDVGNYAPAGVVTPIPGSSSRVGLHFIWRSVSSGRYGVSYGDDYYNTYALAEVALGGIDPYDTVPEGFDKGNVNLLGVAILEKGETDADNGVFIQTNFLGLFGGGLIVAGGSYLEIGQNLADLNNATTARTNLGVEIGVDVQAWDAVLDATTASFTTADETKLDFITVTQAVDLDDIESKANSAVQPAVGQNLTDVQGLFIDGLPDTDHTATGNLTDSFNAGATITAFTCLYMGAAGKWLIADASGTATANKMLAIALEAGTDTNPIEVATSGSYIRDDSWAWTPGDIIYLSETTGLLTQTKPTKTTGVVVKILGYATSADTMFFSPELGVVYS